jgi:hypothetical protein
VEQGRERIVVVTPGSYGAGSDLYRDSGAAFHSLADRESGDLQVTNETFRDKDLGGKAIIFPDYRAGSRPRQIFFGTQLGHGYTLFKSFS